MNDSMDRDPDQAFVEAIYDALDAGRPAEALHLVRRALAEDDTDPVLYFFAGEAELEMDRAEEAARHFARAVELDPEDAEFRARLALAHAACCRFAEAKAAAREALSRDERLPDAHEALALALEHLGRLDDADAAFARAARLDPDRFRTPARLAREAFESILSEAMDSLPDAFRRELQQVAVTVEPLPSVELLRAEDPPLPPELFGLFVGVPRGESGVTGPGGELPPRIFLFQRNLERCFPDREELIEEIGVTLRHELGHYLGMDEDEIAEAGHA